MVYLLGGVHTFHSRDSRVCSVGELPADVLVEGNRLEQTVYRVVVGIGLVVSGFRHLMLVEPIYSYIDKRIGLALILKLLIPRYKLTCLRRNLVCYGVGIGREVLGRKIRAESFVADEVSGNCRACVRGGNNP